MPDDEPAGARPFDGFGFATLSFALVCLQLVLDRGERAYWFDSWLITGLLLASLSALWVFAVHSHYSKHPYIPSELFRDRNYVGSMVVTAVTSGVFMSNVSILAPMMQSVLGYTARDAGFMIGPRGITVVLGVAVANYARRYIADRTLIAIGLVGAALSIWEMTTFSIETDQRTVLVVGMAQGFWYGIHFVPLMTVTFATLAPHLRTDGAALVQLFRQLVGGIGIAITFSSINHNMHGWSQELRGRVNVDADAWWSVLGHYGVQGTGMLQSEIARQAALLAFEHAIGWLAVALVLMLPLLLLIRGGKTGTSPQVVPGDVP
jgi:DHA2 family multidrug resistance protein